MTHTPKATTFADGYQAALTDIGAALLRGGPAEAMRWIEANAVDEAARWAAHHEAETPQQFAGGPGSGVPGIGPIDV